MPKNTEAVSYCHQVKDVEVELFDGVASGQGEQGGQVADLFKLLQWICDIPGVPMLDHRAAAVLHQWAHIRNPRIFSNAVEASILTHTIQNLTEGFGSVCRSLGLWVVYELIEAAELSTS